MKTAIAIDSKAVELLSKITGKPLDERDATPPVLFLTALMNLLLGVIAADQMVSDEEKQRWQITIKRFVVGKANTQLAQLLSRGIRERKIYTQVDALQTLTATFSDSEKLLLLALGYEMSLADGSADPTEKAYLQGVAAQLGVKYTHLSVLEASWTQQAIVNPSALEEVRFLLDPSRFRNLDAVFTNAASELWEVLPAQTNKFNSPTQPAAMYAQLEKFQQSRRALDVLCQKLYSIIQEGIDQDLSLSKQVADVLNISKKLQSQKFRLAVLGEFSQGKSSLLNALLGEKIQPVRALPCSGTLSILRYGAEKRVICRYRDGRQEEIALEDYKEKAAIPKEVAMGGTLREALAQTEIQELIFEHPNLELCKNGVEIIDSPGLNEHPDRTALTYQILKETDAAIFLANATRPLTESEQALLQDLKTQLNAGRSDRPAANLFVAVNFMDMLDKEEDSPQDVQQRFKRFLNGNPPILTGDNRIHYISY
jgi:uncharacterized tellurite resistance protein B-like protein/GTPase SAR1 family protein